MVAFTRDRHGGRCVDPGSLLSLGFSLGVVGFIRGHWVDSDSPCGSLGLYGVVGFTRVRAGGRWDRLIHSNSPWGSLDTLGFAVGVVGFIRGHTGLPWGSLCSCGFLGFTLVRHGCRRVHSGLPWGSLGS